MKSSANSLRRGIIAQIIVPAFISTVLLIAGYLITTPFVKSMMINERKQMALEMVNSIYNLLNGYNEQVMHGELTLAEAQAIVVNSVKHQRYGKNQANYFWIQNYEGNFIFHPFFGTNSKTQITPQTEKTAHQMANLAKQQNEGFVTYNWQNPQNKIITYPKQAYVKGYKPWGWIIGTGFLLADIELEMQQMSRTIMTLLFEILAGLIFILIFILIRNYKNLQKILIKDIELKKNEARFRGFAQNTSNGVVIFENETIAFVNEEFCKIFGINQSEALLFNIQDYLPDWEKERVKILMTSIPVNLNLAFETWVRLEDQTEKYINIRVICDLSSTITYKYLIYEDRTQQKRTLTTLDVLSETLKQSPASIVITDLNGIIEYVNPGFEKATGFSYLEAIGQNPRILKSNKMPAMIYDDLWQTISQGQIWKGEMINQKKDGSLLWESTIIFPVKNEQNEIIKYSAIKTDISQSKEIEQELLTARDKAKESERLKSSFLNNISHEVRTPLNAVYGFTQFLKAEFNTNDNAIGYLTIMEQNCQALLRLFSDIIDFSSIEAGAITLYKEDVQLNELILKIVSKYNTKLAIKETKPIEIVVDSDKNFDTMVLYTDRKRITQIFDKLISNAIKFTVEGEVSISYTIYPEYIEFHISDTGVGIPEDEKELIFESFSHGANMFVSLHKGVGLGLNIAKLLVEILGGKLSFSSRQGKGTTFSFTFPTIDLKNYSIDGNQVISYNPSICGKNILIAEDNDESFKYFETLLAPQNMILRAKTGMEAVKIIEKRNTPIDMILMDILMPELDGIMASKMIRKIQPSLPIIAVTAVGYVLIDSETNVFDTILIKPVGAKVLLRAIFEVFEKKILLAK